MTVLVCCHGSICRSPTAGAIMRAKGVPNVVVAGLKEMGAKRAKSPPKVREWVQENLGLDLSEHRANPLTKELLEAANIILYMDGGQRKRLEARWEEWGLAATRGPLDARLRPLGAFLTPQSAKIGDPMFAGNKDAPAFQAIMRQLVEASEAFAQWYLESSQAAEPVVATEQAGEPIPHAALGQEAAA